MKKILENIDVGQFASYNKKKQQQGFRQLDTTSQRWKKRQKLLFFSAGANF